MSEQKKRQTLTPEQRVARAQAELAEAQAKAEAAARKSYDKLVVEHDKLSTQISEKQERLDSVVASIAAALEMYPGFAPGNSAQLSIVDGGVDVAEDQAVEA